MIAANKRLLKATLTEGVLGIQINLIQLYQANLSAVATQAALIAGFSFSAITTEFVHTYGSVSTVLSYVIAVSPFASVQLFLPCLSRQLW